MSNESNNDYSSDVDPLKARPAEPKTLPKHFSLFGFVFVPKAAYEYMHVLGNGRNYHEMLHHALKTRFDALVSEKASLQLKYDNLLRQSEAHDAQLTDLEARLRIEKESCQYQLARIDHTDAKLKAHHKTVDAIADLWYKRLKGKTVTPKQRQEFTTAMDLAIAAIFETEVQKCSHFKDLPAQMIAEYKARALKNG